MAYRLLFFLLSTMVFLKAETSKYEISLLQQRVDQLSERVEGLTTIVEGFNITINNLKMSQDSINDKNLSVTVEQLNQLTQECVTHKELKDILANYDKLEKNNISVNTNETSNVSKKDDRETVAKPSDETSNTILYREGAQFFQKQQYDKAYKRFTLMVEKNYKPASSNYYLGEIAYYTKKYSDAIYYFKKSASIYDKASYIDILLLHTAISLEKEGDRTQAKIFYQTIINDYPENKSAKIAKNKLQKL